MNRKEGGYFHAVELRKARRIVVKIGTNVITRNDGHLAVSKIKSLVAQTVYLKNAGSEKRDVLVVTSGAIGAGMAKLGLGEKPMDLVLKQASAAVGQSSLMHYYERYFQKYNQLVAQVLLTQDDWMEETKRLNLNNALSTLLKLDVIPIINENDVVATDEIASTSEDGEEWLNFSDNDTLSAAIACELGADLLILLSNVDGVFDSYPITKSSKLIEVISYKDQGVEKIAELTNGKSKYGRGGMLSKIKAAKTAAEKGVATIIANGCEKNILSKLLDGNGRCTFFEAKKLNGNRGEKDG